MLLGEEITGRNWHITAAGIHRRVDWDQTAAEAIEDVHAQGGIAIAAHPVRAFWGGFDDRALALLDGVEAAHPGIYVDEQFKTGLQAFHQRARERKPGIAAIGSSDFHGMPSPGLCHTYVLSTAPTEAGVIEAVRSGRTVAADRDGNLTGDPAHVLMVQAGRRTVEPPAAADLARRISVASTWIGLLGMVIFAGRPSRVKSPST